jgi:hypothetical protein
VWQEAHRLLPLLEARRAELRESLSHLGLAFLTKHATSIFDLRRAAGTTWFDEHYAHKGL